MPWVFLALGIGYVMLAGKAGNRKPEAGSQNMPERVGNARWIQSAIRHPGALRRQLGIPEGRRIPPMTLARAARDPGLLGKRARLALRLRAMRQQSQG